MTREQFIAMIEEVETGGLRDRLRAIGDGGKACGAFQQHWDWRVDYWPRWAWEVLRVLDKMALQSFVERHRPEGTARELACLYNLGHKAPDPSYEQKCLSALITLGIPSLNLDREID